MIFRIPAGKHYARPWRLGLYWRKTSFAWVVKFDESCRYDLGNDDQGDTNKLVGVGYLPHHHKDSARFGWLYSTERKEIEISAYCYVDGRRVIQHIGFVPVGKWCRVRLNVATYYYYFELEVSNRGWYEPAGNCILDKDHNKKLGYRLGPYFGGNQVAPHEMKITIEKT